MRACVAPGQRRRTGNVRSHPKGRRLAIPNQLAAASDRRALHRCRPPARPSPTHRGSRTADDALGSACHQTNRRGSVPVVRLRLRCHKPYHVCRRSTSGPRSPATTPLPLIRARCAPCSAPPDRAEIVQSTSRGQCSFEGFLRWRLDHRCQADRGRLTALWGRLSLRPGLTVRAPPMIVPIGRSRQPAFEAGGVLGLPVH
jgi:hypothetical protein